MWFVLAVACSGPQPSVPPPEGDADTDTDTDSDTDTDTDADTDLDCIGSGTHGLEGPPVATGVGEHLTVGDVDGDGDDDAVGLATLGIEAASLQAVDLDGDGRDEVVAGWTTTPPIGEVFPPCLGPVIRYTAATTYTFDGTWQPAGTWRFEHRQWLCGTVSDFHIQAAGPDILVEERVAGLWLLPPTAGDVDLTSAATLRVERVGGADAGDVDGDGVTDVVAGTSGGVWLFAGDLGRVRAEDGELLWDSGAPISVGDADGDGLDDVLVGSLLIDAQGNELASLSGGGDFVPDLDGDGTAEIVELIVGGANIWLGPVQGTEVPPTLAVVGPDLQAVQTGDTDGDGGVEMLVQDGAGDVFSLLVCP